MELAKDPLPFHPEHERGELAGSLSLAAGRDDTEHLDERRVERGIDLDPTHLGHVGDGPAHQAASASPVWAYVRAWRTESARTTFGSRARPQAGLLQGLPGGNTVRGILGVGDGDLLDLGPPQVGKAVDLVADGLVDAEHELTACVRSDRPGIDGARGGQVLDELRVGGQEDVERRARLDLLGQPPRGVEREGRRGSRSARGTARPAGEGPSGGPTRRRSGAARDLRNRRPGPPIAERSPAAPLAGAHIPRGAARGPRGRQPGPIDASRNLPFRPRETVLRTSPCDRPS